MDRRPGVFLLTDQGSPPSCEGLYPASASREAVEGDGGLLPLAHALSASPIWQEMPNAVMLVRPAPRPLLALLGYFDAAAVARVEALRWQLENLLPRARYVSYAQAEADCTLLAARLQEQFKSDQLRRFRFVGIPRGGLIVLGMLAYALKLSPDQLQPSGSPETPLVVVDDCALTGHRFGQFLQGWESTQVVFAHLYSHPALRSAIRERESRVIACVSAQNLPDHAPERLGDGYAAWRERWTARSASSCFWVGQPDHVCFAWSEPDVSHWNPVTDREEPGWRLIPPALCLKNRNVAGAAPERVQVQPAGKGPLRPSARVLFGELDGQVVVAHLGTEACYALTDTAAAMWRAILQYGALDDALAALRREYDADGATLCADLSAFVQQLLDRDLLENGKAPHAAD